MADDQTTKPAKGSSAAAMIAELWAEREQSGPAAPVPTPGPAPRPPAAPRREADGRQRALAVAIAGLLVGGALGVVAITLGIIGAPSKAAFAADADRICASTNGGVNAIAKPAGFPTLATAASTLVSTTDTQLGRLRTLDLPGGADRTRTKGVLDAIAATNAAGRTLQSAATAGDAGMVATASRSIALSWQDALAKARDYGFTACVTGMQPGADALVAGANGVIKGSFVEKGNSICIDFLRSVDAVPEIRNANDIPRFVSQNAALLDELVVDLKALPVSPGDEATVAAMIATMDDMSAKVKELTGAAAAADVKRLTAIQKESEALEAVANEKFGAYGLTVCGSSD